MRVLSIHAKNYRTLEDLAIDFSTGYCTISGRNNTGKSCLIRLLEKLFKPTRAGPWFLADSDFTYKEDKTQWVTNDDAPIIITYRLNLSNTEDPALLSFINKMAGLKIEDPSTVLNITFTIDKTDKVHISRIPSF